MIAKNLATVEKFRDEAKNLREYRRALAVIMWIRGYSAFESSQVLGLSRAAVYRNLQNYKQTGVEGLKSVMRKGRPTKVTSEYIHLLQRVSSNPPSDFGYSQSKWTLKLLRDHLVKETGKSFSLEHLRRIRENIINSSRNQD